MTVLYLSKHCIEFEFYRASKSNKPYTCVLDVIQATGKRNMCRIRCEFLRQVGCKLLLYYIKDREAYMSCHKYLLTLEKAGAWKGVHKICMNKAEVVKGHLSHLVFEALTESAMTSAGTGPIWLQKNHIVLYIGVSSGSLHLFMPARIWMVFLSPPAILTTSEVPSLAVHLVSFSFFRFHLKCYFVIEALITL